MTEQGLCQQYANFLSALQLHESGFARAVGPGQAIALAWRKCHRDFVEQNFGAVAHGNIANGKHDCWFSSSGFYWETSSGSVFMKLRGISAKTVRSWS